MWNAAMAHTSNRPPIAYHHAKPNSNSQFIFTSDRSPCVRGKHEGWKHVYERTHSSTESASYAVYASAQQEPSGGAVSMGGELHPRSRQAAPSWPPPRALRLSPSAAVSLHQQHARPRSHPAPSTLPPPPSALCMTQHAAVSIRGSPGGRRRRAGNSTEE